jgi:hypothetical protein
VAAEKTSHRWEAGIFRGIRCRGNTSARHRERQNELSNFRMSA